MSGTGFAGQLERVKREALTKFAILGHSRPHLTFCFASLPKRELLWGQLRLNPANLLLNNVFIFSPNYPLSSRWSFSFLCLMVSRMEIGSKVGLATDHNWVSNNCQCRLIKTSQDKRNEGWASKSNYTYWIVYPRALCKKVFLPSTMALGNLT